MGRHGENIRKRKDGRWEARVIDGYLADGKAHYRCLYGKTYQEAKRKKHELLAAGAASLEGRSRQMDGCKMTYGQLIREWLDSRKGSVKETTFVNYANLVEKHLLPELGGLALSAVTADVLDAFLRAKLETGRLDGSGGLAPKTVADLRSILLMSVEYAHSREYLFPVNHKLFYPPYSQPGIRVLTRNEQARLEEVLFASEGLPELGILIALYGGLRIGEVCALQWDDISLADGTVSINKTILRIRDLDPDVPAKTKIVIDRPKTASSVRIVPLPSFVVQHIETYRGQSGQYLLTGTAAFMEPRVCLDKYKKILKQAGVPDCTFHALRHTFATRCVEHNFDPKSLSEILGHANVTTTMQRYVHPSMELKKAQMERLQGVSVYGQDRGRK